MMSKQFLWDLVGILLLTSKAYGLAFCLPFCFFVDTSDLADDWSVSMGVAVDSLAFLNGMDVCVFPCWVLLLKAVVACLFMV